MAVYKPENEALMQSDLLPPCDGPKLPAFKHRFEPIEWLERLDDPEESRRGHVFRVKIRGQEYALKVFRFFDANTERYMLDPRKEGDISDDLLAFHTDPFFAECRAYARIQEDTARCKNKERERNKVAAACYGFLSLDSKATKPILLSYGIDLWSDIDPDDDYRIKAEGSPIRALVKELLVPSEMSTLNVRRCRRMLRSVKTLSDKLHIVHRNIDAYAFHHESGRLFSFSSSFTLAPHCIFDIMDHQLAEDRKFMDKVMFDNVSEEAGLLDRVRAMPDFRYCKKLRSRQKSYMTSLLHVCPTTFCN